VWFACKCNDLIDRSANAEAAGQQWMVSRENYAF
jgi:hypothetical protein